LNPDSVRTRRAPEKQMLELRPPEWMCEMALRFACCPGVSEAIMSESITKGGRGTTMRLSPRVTWLATVSTDAFRASHSLTGLRVICRQLFHNQIAEG
jgi:hypothetical protein